jgi:hypothetical protein
MPPLGRNLLRGAVLAAAALLVFPAVAVTEPPTLESEHLVGAIENVNIQFECDDPQNSPSTVTFSASGTATGPFPGTFVASGSLTIGPQTEPGVQAGTNAGPILNLTETFTITSGATTVTGTKTLQPDATFESGTLGTCQDVANFAVGDVTGDGTVVDVTAATQYDATISGPGGTSTDSGLAFFTLSEIAITGSCPAGVCNVRIGGYDELFAVSDRLASTPGHSNGGGQVDGPTGNNVTFAFHGRSKNGILTGGCNVLDLVMQRHIKCNSVTRYVQAGNAVTIRGQGTDNGVPTLYVIEAVDNGEPGHGSDEFSIQTGSGFSAGGVITNGNVQVR